MKTLVFHNITFDIIDRNGQPWLRVSQIGRALGYAQPDAHMTRLYQSHADEFTAAMTAVVKLPSAGGMQDVRIFSLRGAHLLAMLSRTQVAKEFRMWVLDVLEQQASEPRYPDARNNLPTLNDPAFVMLCQAHASRVAGHIANQLFQKLLQQDQNSLDGDRFLLTFRGDTPFFERIEPDALVANLSRLTQMIGNPNGMMVDQAQLADLLATCSARLAKSIQYQLRMTKKNQRI